MMARILIIAQSRFRDASSAPFKRMRSLIATLEGLGQEVLHLDLDPTAKGIPIADGTQNANVITTSASTAIHRGGGFNPLFVRHCAAITTSVAHSFKPDIVVASSPPVAALLAAAMVKRRHPGIHLHVDFRDPYNSSTATLPVPSAVRAPFRMLLRHYDQRLRRVLHLVDSSSHAFASSRNSIMRQLSPRVPDHLWENGADLGEIGAVTSANRQSNRVVYVGSFTDYYYPEWLFPGLRHLPHLEYLIVGSGPRRMRILADSAYPAVSAQVSFTGRLTAPKALRALKTAAVAVHAPDPSQDFALSTKVLEYIASGAQVLSFTSPSSPVTELLARWSIGLACAGDDGQAIAEKVQALLKRGPYDPRTQCPGLDSFDRIAKARRFAQWLLESWRSSEVRRDLG